MFAASSNLLPQIHGYGNFLPRNHRDGAVWAYVVTQTASHTQGGIDIDIIRGG